MTSAASKTSPKSSNANLAATFEADHCHGWVQFSESGENGVRLACSTLLYVWYRFACSVVFPGRQHWMICNVPMLSGTPAIVHVRILSTVQTLYTEAPSEHPSNPLILPIVSLSYCTTRRIGATESAEREKNTTNRHNKPSVCRAGDRFICCTYPLYHLLSKRSMQDASDITNTETPGVEKIQSRASMNR